MCREERIEGMRFMLEGVAHNAKDRREASRLAESVATLPKTAGNQDQGFHWQFFRGIVHTNRATACP